MKKGLRILISISAIIIVGLTAAYFILNEPLPAGKQGEEADQLAVKMMDALGHKAFLDTRFYSWSFAGIHHYKWDSHLEVAQVSWDDYRVIFDTRNHLDGEVFQNDSGMTGEEAKDLLQKAWSYYCNDSFWVFAPFKVMDPGTSRSIVVTENGDKNLLVSYESGGVTPGDSYLWVLDENYLPQSFKMWVSIIPVGGVEAGWSDYKEFDGGLKLVSLHDLGIYELEISNVGVGNTPESVNWKNYSKLRGK